MDIPLRRILRTFYPERFSARRLKKVGARFAIKRFVLTLLLVLILIKGVFLLFYYNTFLSMLYDVEEARAQIDTQLQRRKNIILSMNVMVLDYAKHEKDIFEYAADTRKEMLEPESRTSPKDGPTPDQQLPRAAGNLETALSNIFAVAERYPNLRLSENFQRFMDALVDVESKVAQERMLYNKRANDMSTAVGQFPGFIFAKIYGFAAPPFFESEAEARKPPKVEVLAP